MVPVSVVIITKNEESNIVDCILSARLLSDDIIVVDTGSTDNTISLALQAGTKTIAVAWQGYGNAKNIGAAFAAHDWIFSLDADERLSPRLADAIKNLPLKNTSEVYRFKRKNYLNQTAIRFGTAGHDKITRLYHCKMVQWDLSPVHEKLLGEYKVKRISGSVLHYGKSWEDYSNKLIGYARLSADKYFAQRKKANLVKRFLAPVFNAAKSYVFQLGFLDGFRGFRLAQLIALYTWLKYENLHQLNTGSKNKKVSITQGTATTKPSIAFVRK